jgi:hypothetical protein
MAFHPSFCVGAPRVGSDERLITARGCCFFLLAYGRIQHSPARVRQDIADTGVGHHRTTTFGKVRGELKISIILCMAFAGPKNQRERSS